MSWLLRERNAVAPKDSPFFPQLHVLSMMLNGMEYPFGQLAGKAFPAVSSPSFLAGGALREPEEALTVEAVLSTSLLC